MSWAKFDDQYPDHPKIMRVGPLGMALHLAATCYCARYLTDGFVPAGMINKLVNFDGITVNSNAVTNATVTQELTSAGLLDVVEGGYMVHDYLEYNPPAASVKAERAANASRQKDWRDNNRGKNGKFNSNGNSNGVTNGKVTTAPSPSPYPTIPNIGNNINKVEETPPTDNFEMVQREFEKCGVLVNNAAAIKAVNEIIQSGATVEDIKNGLAWKIANSESRVIYAGSLVGPTKTAMQKRLQNGTAHKPTNHVYAETYE